MKHRLLISLTLMLCLASPGCIFEAAAPPAVRPPAGMPTAPAASTPAKITRAGDAVSTAIDGVDPAVTALELLTRKRLSDETLTRGAAGASRVERLARTGAAVAATVAAVPGPQQPIVGIIAAALAALTGVAGSVSAFFNRRKRRRTERALGAVMAGVDPLTGAGKAIVAAAHARGVGDVVEAEYRNSVAK